MKKKPKILQGKVTSTKMDKTIVVVINKSKTHPIYLKSYKVSRRYYAHDEKNIAKKGNQVIIEEARPVSKLKRWRLVKVLNSK